MYNLSVLSKLPKICIRYNHLIDPIFIEYCKHYPKGGWDSWVPPTKEEVLRRVGAYKAEWKKYEEKILNGLCDLLDLSFGECPIDVHIVSGNPRQISFPLIIKSGFTPDEFVNVFTEELTHRLFGLNKLGKAVVFDDPKYEKETETTKKHVIIHSILKYIYLDILNEPKRLEMDLQSSKKHSPNEYGRSWDIVDKEGYKKIISDFKEKIKKP
jgi:hypothetical protein